MRLIVPYITFNVGLLAAFLWSGPLAYESAVLAGYLAEAHSETAKVTQKAHTTTRTFRGMEHRYWIAWTDQDIRWEGPHRVAADKALWDRTQFGDTMTLVHVGTKKTPIWKESVQAPALKALLHASLLAVETAGIAWAGLTLRTQMRERRRRLQERQPRGKT